MACKGHEGVTSSKQSNMQRSGIDSWQTPSPHVAAVVTFVTVAGSVKKKKKSYYTDKRKCCAEKVKGVLKQILSVVKI